jgi:hypothetical protein
MTGNSVDYQRDLSLQLGEYVQVHEEDEPRNGENPRTRGAICLGPSGNKQGGFKFLSLQSGKEITRMSWDALPMPDTVITRLETLAKGQPEQLIFTDRKGRAIGNAELTGVGVDRDLINDDTQDDDVLQNDIDLDTPNRIKHSQLGDIEYNANYDPPAVNNEPTLVVEQPIVPERTSTPVNITGVRRSTRDRTTTVQPHQPSFGGKKYATTMAQLHENGVLHPDAQPPIQPSFK